MRLSPIPRIGHYALLTGNCIATNKRQCIETPPLKDILRYFQYNILFFYSFYSIENFCFVFIFQVASSIAILATVASFELLLHEQSKCFSMGKSPLSTPKGKKAGKLSQLFFQRLSIRGCPLNAICLPCSMKSKLNIVEKGSFAQLLIALKSFPCRGPISGTLYSL